MLNFLGLSPHEILARVRDMSDADKRDLDELLGLAKRPPDFQSWLQEVSPTWTWDWPHLVYVQQQLARLTAGDIDKLAVYMPPRHGKTEMTTVRYPVYRLEQNPTLRAILAAHTQRLANKFSRKVRKIAAGRLALSRERNAAEEWETEVGGGLRAVGVGGAPTGEGATLIIIDDPIRSAEDALSEATREAVWEWYTETLYTRREPGCGMLLINTRWHEDDLSGRIMASEDGPNWSVVSLPALAEENDPLGRAEGEALCPERFDRATLLDIERVLKIGFAAQYQQRPMPRSGGMIQRAWLSQFVFALPKGCQFVRYWDKAGTEGDGCYTVGVLMAKDRDGFFYVVDVVRAQLAYHEREQLIKLTAELDKLQWGHVETWFEVEGGSTGKDIAALSIRNLAGFSIAGEHPTGNKEARLLPFANQCGAGSVKIYKGGNTAWIEPWINELCTFPRGKYKDQADATSGAFNKLSFKAGPIEVNRNIDPRKGTLVNSAPRGVFGK